MESLSDGQTEKRAQLRDKYDEAVSDLLQVLESEPKAAYSSDDLAKLRVTLGSFDPEDQDFLDSEACLFQPLSLEELEEYSLDPSKLGEGSRYWFLEFDRLYQSPEGETNSSRSRIMRKNAEQIFHYLKVLYTKLVKKSKRDRFYFLERSRWNQIR